MTFDFKQDLFYAFRYDPNNYFNADLVYNGTYREDKFIIGSHE